MKESVAHIELIYKGDLVERYKILQNEPIVVGRKGFAVDIEIDDKTVTKRHLVLEWDDLGLFVLDKNSLNGTYVNNKRIGEEPKYLKAEDIIHLGKGKEYCLYVKKIHNVKQATRQQNFFPPKGKVLADFFEAHQEITIGRKGFGAVLELNDPEQLISKMHASVIQKDQKYFIKDFNSTNGTYVNGERIKSGRLIRIHEKDKIYIGLHVIAIKENTEYLPTKPAIQGIRISKTFHDNSFFGGASEKKVLKEMSLEVNHQEFVALMGPSGCGKSTLLKILYSNNPASTGVVYIYGKNNFEDIKNRIGYVPQEEILHDNLSVKNTLYFAAKLRMGKHVKDDTIQTKIDEVLNKLKINTPTIQDQKVRDLSGGEKKRVSIAIELLNNPSVLFLDEPTSSLDPETIKEFLNCLIDLKHQGTTIVMVTHKPEDLEFVDKVLFLNKNGGLSYYGEKGEALLSYFDKKDVIEVYSELCDESKEGYWYEKWQGKLKISTHRTKKEDYKHKHKSNRLYQFFWLSTRYLNTKINDKRNLLLLFLQPIVIACLTIIAFDTLQIGVLFLMTISAIWFGVSNAAKEIVEELPIYFRERMNNLRLSSYLMSKVLILSIFACVQIIIFTLLISYFLTGGEVGIISEGKYIYFLSFVAVSATIMGLLVSAVFSSVEKVLTFVPIILIPQIMLSGVITQIDSHPKEVLSYFTLSRWGVEGLARIQDKSYHQTNSTEIRADIQSVYQPIPKESIKLILAKQGISKFSDNLLTGDKYLVGAMDILNFYSKDRIAYSKKDTPYLPLIIISIIDVASLFSLSLIMKAKNSS